VRRGVASRRAGALTRARPDRADLFGEREDAAAAAPSASQPEPAGAAAAATAAAAAAAVAAARDAGADADAEEDDLFGEAEEAQLSQPAGAGESEIGVGGGAQRAVASAAPVTLKTTLSAPLPRNAEIVMSRLPPTLAIDPEPFVPNKYRVRARAREFSQCLSHRACATGAHEDAVKARPASGGRHAGGRRHPLPPAAGPKRARWAREQCAPRTMERRQLSAARRRRGIRRDVAAARVRVALRRQQAV
jgi:hypothetical protein